MASVVTSSRSSDGRPNVIIISAEYDAAIPMQPDEARVLARKLIEAAHRIEQPSVETEWP